MSFGSKVSRALRFLEIPVKDRASVSFLKNPDLQPIKSVNQTWGFWSNFAYWGVMSFSVGTWMSASAALGVGLSYPETIGTFIVGVDHYFHIGKLVSWLRLEGRFHFGPKIRLRYLRFCLWYHHQNFDEYCQLRVQRLVGRSLYQYDLGFMVSPLFAPAKHLIFESCHDH